MTHSHDMRRGARLASGAAAVAMVASLAAAAVVAPPPSVAQTPGSPDMRLAQTFACGSAGKMKAIFSSDRGGFTAYVLWPDQPVRMLDVQPPTGEPLVAWSDGARTLTWNPGVRLTWMDRASPSMVHCSRDGGHDHPAPTPAPAPAAPDQPLHQGHGI